MLPSLRELDAANNYCTDKLGRCRINCHDYTSNYEFHFSPLRLRPIVFWEIGVQRGDSLRLWSDYFPIATVVGLDITPPPADWSPPPRTVFRLTNATDADAVNDLVKLLPPDVVLDDGSHCARDLRSAFNLLWPHTRLMYVIEDFGTQYGLNGPRYLDAAPFHEDVQMLADSLVCNAPVNDCSRVCYEAGQVYLYKKPQK